MGEALDEIRDAGGDAVAVFQYDGPDTQGFCTEQGVPFDCLGDPKLDGYAAVGLGKGSLWQYLGPQMFGAILAAAREGHFVGLPRGGSIALNPGTFVVGRDGEVLFAHYNADSADNALSAEVIEAVRSAPAPARP